ncbi:MAG TPA: hypothetical protein VH083_03060 [Myxococcales bacterium]|nr:hypothetical protein [Myxococcales bacterium]
MPPPSEPAGQPRGDVAGQPRGDDDSGPLKRLSFYVLLALAIEIVLLVILGKAAL